MSEELQVQKLYGLNRSSSFSASRAQGQDDATDNERESAQAKIKRLREQALGNNSNPVSSSQEVQRDPAQELFLKKKALTESLANRLGENIPKLSKNNIDDILNKLILKIKEMSPGERIHSGIQELIDSQKEMAMMNGLSIPQLSEIESISPEEHFEITGTRKKPPALIENYQKVNNEDLEFLSSRDDKFKPMNYFHQRLRT